MLGRIGNDCLIFVIKLGEAGVIRLVRRTRIVNREPFCFLWVPYDSFTSVANAANAA